MRLMQEETFGPVLAIVPVENADEAVAAANDSPFGLSASVWTSDTARGRSIAARLRCGAVMVNDVASYFGIAEAPHGGRSASGWGRSHSRHGLMEMVQVKYVDVDRLPRFPKAWWFGYNREGAESADAFLEFLFDPSWTKRWTSAKGAMKALFRKHRI
jgi:succinate-semialdehyde dehydrogenase/glutarate-semialdehyde dehydrogenase